MDRRGPYKVRDLPQVAGFFGSLGERSIGSSFMPLVNQTRWEFIPSGEELVPSDREPVHFCVLNSYSIISTLYINRCLIKTQLLDLLSTNSL